MKQMIIYATLSLFIMGCQPCPKEDQLMLANIHDLITQINEMNFKLDANQLIDKLGEPERIFLYHDFLEFIKKDATENGASSCISHIQWVLQKDYSEYNVEQQSLEFYIYALNNQCESIVTGYLFGLVSKKTGIFRIPYFVIYKNEVLFGDFYMKPMPEEKK